MLKDRVQSDHSAVAPTDDADALRVDEIEVFEGPLGGGPDIVDLASPIVDLVVELRSIAGAAAVVASDDCVALLYKLARDVGVAGVEACVNALVDEDDQRALLRFVNGLRNEGIGVDDDRIGGSRSCWHTRLGDGQAGEHHLVDSGDVLQLQLPHEVVDGLENRSGAMVRGLLWIVCRLGRDGWCRGSPHGWRVLSKSGNAADNKCDGEAHGF